MSQSPLTMHSLKQGKQNNISQQQLANVTNQASQITVGQNAGIINPGRGGAQMTSPIRESLIKNTGAFILGGGSSNTQSTGVALANQNSRDTSAVVGVTGGSTNNPTAAANFSTMNQNSSNIDLSNAAAGNNFQRDRSADRAMMDYADGSYGGANGTNFNSN